MLLSDYVERVIFTIDENAKGSLMDGESVCTKCDHKDLNHTHKDCEDCLFNPKYATEGGKKDLAEQLAHIKGLEALGILGSD